MTTADRYLDLIDATLKQARRAPRLIPLPADAESDQSFEFTDGAGHRRPPYRGLAMRSWLLGPNADPTVARSFIDQVMPSLQAFADDDAVPDAITAATVVAAIFDAGAVESSRDASTRERDLAARCFAHVVANQQPDGTFLARTSTDNPEPLWYAELALLHAIHVHAVEQNDVDAREAAGRATRYLAAEVQPDHASAQPWAIAALLEEPDGIALADTMLHVAGVQKPSTMDAVSLLLLADALRCGREGKSR